MKEYIETLSACKNQICTLHRSKVTYLFNSHTCGMFYYRALMHVKSEILKSTLKLVYILGCLFNEKVY